MKKKRIQTKFKGKGMTEQHHAKKLDVNYLVNKYVPGQSKGIEFDIEDVIEIPGMTYHEAMNKIVSAQQKFEQLPSEIRSMYNHDPMRFMDQLQMEGGIEEYQDYMRQYLDIEDRQVDAPQEPPPGGAQQTETPVETQEQV